MALHHRREIPNMRHAYESDNKRDNRRSASSSGSDRSNYTSSNRSYQTQPTSYSSSPPKRPPHVHYNSSDSRYKDTPSQYFEDRHPQESPRSSVETYASTVLTEEDLAEDVPEYSVPEYTGQQYEPTSIPAAPEDFSQLFPSHRRLNICHDDSTLDGNMNLRIDTEVSIHGHDCDMTLFHLRMHDLKNREFSLRRYCRDSGREVCHSLRKHQKPAAERRPGIQRSLSNALHSMRPKTESRSSTSPTMANLKRNDSGYGSMHSVDFDDDDRPASSGHGNTPESALTNSIKLEFSNYAQVEIKRTGVKSTKRYEFEYWGVHYAWKRVARRDGGVTEMTYHLTKAGSERVLAYVVPASLTDRQAHVELDKGGWIPPCTMWIADEQTIRSQKDTSDVVVASGLIALVDDSIRTHFHSKDAKQLLIPSKLQMGVQFVGPKRLINEMYSGKKESGQRSRPSSSGGPSSTGSSSAGMRRPTGSSRQHSYEY